MEDEVEFVASRDLPSSDLQEDDSRRRNVIPLIWKESCAFMAVAQALMIMIASLVPDPVTTSEYSHAVGVQRFINVAAITLFAGTIFRSLVGFSFVSPKQRPIL